MAGKHAAPSAGNGKKVLVIVIIIVAVVLLAAGGLFVFKMLNPDKGGSSKSATATQAVTAAATTGDTAPTATDDLPGAPPTTEQPFGTEEPPVNTEHIAIPTEGGEITYFNATYIPSGEAEDITTGAQVSPREVFGQSFANGTITFNDNGTFVSTLSDAGSESGEYLVENGQIKATYYPDRNMDITVTEWNDASKTPASFYIIFGEETGGVKVYFTEN